MTAGPTIADYLDGIRYRRYSRSVLLERRRLCKRCYGAAVRREQAAVAPLPRVILAGSLQRVTASVGRCGVCRLEKAARSGDGVRLCEACYRRESRRAVEAGAEVVAALHRRLPTPRTFGRSVVRDRQVPGPDARGRPSLYEPGLEINN